MTATPARIGFISQEFRSVIAQSDTVKDQYGSLARETDDPMETFFDNVADAQVMADARQELLSARRRRFRVTVAGIDEVLALDYTSGRSPLAQCIDRERSADISVLVSEIIIDMSRQHAALTLWG